MVFMNLLGALGLFLLGMWLMTEGLKLAGGHALKNLLGQWTSSRLRGFMAGLLVTALVQSSSAITVATIGFVNASLMTFQQSIWVIFGSNVGSTLTAWLVTLFGFNINIDAATYPMVGLGALLRAFAPHERGRSLGMALAGFGILFMGISALQLHFGSYAHSIDQSVIARYHSVWLGVGVGLLLTLLTQSSSAAIAIILTAVNTDLVDIRLAAAAVIGANIGTTSTALISTIGATANAKRLASAHVAFNLITAAAAISILPLFSWLVTEITDTAGLENNPTLWLAMFHTSFNILGVLLMWPMEPMLSKGLQKMFVEPSVDHEIPSQLDRNVATVPDLAVRALGGELDELRQIISNRDLAALLLQDAETNDDSAIIKRLKDSESFISTASQSNLTPEHGSQLTAGLSVSHYLRNGIESIQQIMKYVPQLDRNEQRVISLLSVWLKHASQFAADICHTDSDYQHQHWPEMIEQYQQLKKRLLAAAIEKPAALASVDAALQIASLSRRYIEQLLQTHEPFQTLTSQNQDSQDSNDTIAPAEADAINADSGTDGEATPVARSD